MTRRPPAPPPPPAPTTATVIAYMATNEAIAGTEITAPIIDNQVILPDGYLPITGAAYLGVTRGTEYTIIPVPQDPSEYES